MKVHHNTTKCDTIVVHYKYKQKRILMKPMKISHASESQLSEVLYDPFWIMQQKMDGARVLARYSQAREGGFEFLSSMGKPLKYAAATQHLDALREELDMLNHVLDTREVVLDGELMLDGTFYVFDVPMFHSDAMLIGPTTPLTARLRHLSGFMGLPTSEGLVRSLPVFQDISEKHDAFEQFKEAGVEGAIFKYGAGEYLTDGSRAKNQLKYKFVKDADVVILERDRMGTKNAILGVHDDNRDLVEIGSCSMIGKPDLQPGDVALVKYLYWTGAAMIQPRLVEQRTDKLPTECDLEQFPEYSREVVQFQPTFKL